MRNYDKFKSCLQKAQSIVRRYRDQAPPGYDVFNGGGGTPSVPKPPAPPQKEDAAAAALQQLRKRKPQGFQSTILSGPKPTNPSNTTLLGGGS